MKNVTAYIVPLVAAAAIVSLAFNSHQEGGKNYLCSHSYALCTSALCIPMPGEPAKTICFCDVEEGTSMATVPCDQLTPSTDNNGIRTLYSTYSLEQLFQGKKVMKCARGTPWSWCLNKRCTVNPANPKKAICLCDVVRSEEEWVTYGGDCDTATCATSYWSGASLKDSENGTVFLLKALGIKQSPVKLCQAD